MPRTPRRLSPGTFLRRSGFYKGVLGGSRGWLAVFLVMWGGRKAKATFGKNEQYVTTERLQPGQFVTLQAIAPPTRAEKKAAATADKQAAKAAKAAAKAAKAERRHR